MTKPIASTWHEQARMEAAAAWLDRMVDGPLGPDDQGAFDLWKADAPENAETFDRMEAAMRVFDDPRIAPMLDALRAEAYASRPSNPDVKN